MSQISSNENDDDNDDEQSITILVCWSCYETVVNIPDSSSRLHYLFDKLMSHGPWYQRQFVIVDEQHWAEVKVWWKQRHVVDQVKSRSRHR